MEKTEVKRKLNHEKKGTRGITLIALVVTIIVLLILAGISIQMLTGENGILKRATEAREKSEEEQRKLAMLEAATNTKNTTFEGITIPAGFAPTKIEGESTVEDGLVITDSKGNEFVWIPVPKIENFKLIEGWQVNNLQSNFSFDSLTEPSLNGYSSEQVEYDRMKESVQKNNGFFIGRYETGYENGTYNTESNSYSEDTRAVVKRNVKIYAYIKWGNSFDDPSGGACEIAKNFSRNNGYNTVTSTLCYDTQWDAVMQFFDSNYLNSTCQEGSYVRNNSGNISGAVMKAGESNDCMKNIYDMAGNVYEWTMAGDKALRRMSRGARSYPGTMTTPSYRNASNPPIQSEDIGFRIALYIDEV